MNDVIQKIKNWYKGERIEDWQSTGPTGAREFYYKKSPTAQFITSVFGFIDSNKAWLIPMLVTAFIALFFNFSGKTSSTGKTKQKANASINYACVTVHSSNLHFRP